MTPQGIDNLFHVTYMCHTEPRCFDLCGSNQGLLIKYKIKMYKISAIICVNVKSRKISFAHTAVLVNKFIWNFAQSTAVWLPCSVQNCRRIRWLIKRLSTKKDFERFQYKMNFWWIIQVVIRLSRLVSFPGPWSRSLLHFMQHSSSPPGTCWDLKERPEDRFMARKLSWCFGDHG